MKNTNRQTSPNGRSTKKKQVGLSLPVSPLFQCSGNAFIYYNESPFIQNLKRIKFKLVGYVHPLHFVINLACFPKTIKHNNMITTVSRSTHQLNINF